MKALFLFNVSHVVIDGLYENIPILLSFAVLSVGATEWDAGMILSLGAVLSTMLGLSAVFCSQRFGALRTTGLIVLFYGIGFCLSAFSLNLYPIGLSFILASAGHNIFHTTSFAYLSATTESNLRGKIMGNFTAIGDICRIPFLQSPLAAGIPMTMFTPSARSLAGYTYNGPAAFWKHCGIIRYPLDLRSHDRRRFFCRHTNTFDETD